MTITSFATDLAHRIQHVRIKRAMQTQAEAAAEVGVSERTWQNWEAGTLPQMRYRRALEAWLVRYDEAAA